MCFLRPFVLAAGEVGIPRGKRELCVQTRSWLQRFASVTLFILLFKVSGLFTQLRALFSGCEWLFCVSFTWGLSAVIIAYSQSRSAWKEKLMKAVSEVTQVYSFRLFLVLIQVSSVFRSWCLLAEYGGILEVRGTCRSQRARRHTDPEPVFHPGSSLQIHWPSTQQWRHGKRGEEQTLNKH